MVLIVECYIQIGEGMVDGFQPLTEECEAWLPGGSDLVAEKMGFGLGWNCTSTTPSLICFPPYHPLSLFHPALSLKHIKLLVSSHLLKKKLEMICLYGTRNGNKQVQQPFVLYQGNLVKGKAQPALEKDKPVWTPKGRQLNKFRSLMITIMRTN